MCNPGLWRGHPPFYAYKLRHRQAQYEILRTTNGNVVYGIQNFQKYWNVLSNCVKCTFTYY